MPVRDERREDEPMTTYGNGHYMRGEDGRWRYALSGELVKGAMDVRNKRGALVSMWAPELLPERLLCGAQAAALVGRTKNHWQVSVSKGHAPKPVGHVGTMAYWTTGVIKAWLRARAAAREPSGQLPAA